MQDANFYFITLVRNRIRLAVALFILLFSPLSVVFGQAVLPAKLDSMLLDGKNHFYNLRMDAAAISFDKIQSEYPEYPHGFIYEAFMTTIRFAMDKQTDSLATALNTQVDYAVKIAESYIKRSENKADGHFYLGIANGLRGIYHVAQYNYVRAYWYGRKAKNNLNDTIKHDAEYNDAYVGLGIFHYYADLLPGVVKFLAGVLGFQGDKTRGIREIERTRDNGKHFKFEAEFVYYSIRYFLEGDKAASVRGFKSLYKRYADNHGFAIMLAYHYRRTGFMQRCIEYCESFDKDYVETLPLLTNAKYYNMAIASYDLNKFQSADSLLDVLLSLETRKSLYYEAAINYYKGHLADLRMERTTALSFYRKIRKEKQAKYWYYVSQMPQRHPMDDLTKTWHEARNNLFSREFKKSAELADELAARIAAGERSNNPDFELLVQDLIAQNHYYGRRYSKAETVYGAMRKNIGKMKDEFRRSWIYINYNRCLRQLNEFELAKKMLDNAHKLEEEYTRIIISRERFLLKKKEKRTKKA
ncbi:MAG: hypothetical protein ACRBF0_10440 [Calditrichia bacterium]